MDIPLENTAELFKTLSDPTRLRIVKVLTLDCQSVSFIVEATKLSQPLVSHHLRVLRDYGLVRAEPRGGFTYY
ncbi:MAG: winged helix-turn-helix transcriptional regulator [Chloroflexota bacterium]|nr:winged helix-turn-helix transcriptional regulator [Chloroflexota bacterium]